MCNGWLASEHAHDANLGYPRFAAQGATLAQRDLAVGGSPCRHPYGMHLTSITRPTPYLDRLPRPSPGRAGNHRPTGAVAAGEGG